MGLQRHADSLPAPRGCHFTVEFPVSHCLYMFELRKGQVTQKLVVVNSPYYLPSSHFC